MPDLSVRGQPELMLAGFLSVVLTATSSAADLNHVVDTGKSRKALQSSRRLFVRQYHKPDLSFCNSAVCVDFDNDGRREIMFASRRTKELQMLNAAEGSVIWSRKFVGDQQSIMACDLDGDGKFEILYSVSSPGRLYVLDAAGEVLRQWDSGDSKLGNSAVILDVDGDGRLDGLLGTRYRYLVRLKMADLTPAQQRSDWVQCGCHTSAMDVDRDGLWDCFAGSGDDTHGKGVLHRFDPLTLKSLWSYKTNDNASSADAVLADIDGDGQVEVIKSVDNYADDDAHDAIFAFRIDGKLLWEARGFAGEDSPNVADLDGDGDVEIIGMTFGGEVYCLDSNGLLKWRRDLRPALSDRDAHAYLTPILCDVNGDRDLEIIALTNGGYFDASGRSSSGQRAVPGIVFAVSADGEILDQFDVGGPRYWGDAFACNVDEDPYLELVVSGSGGLDVIQTEGFGPNTEHFQRRRSYQRLNVVPWAYEDSYFIGRGTKQHVVNLTDNLVLAKDDGRHRSSGKFTTELLTPPPDGFFDQISWEARTSDTASLKVNILDRFRHRICSGLTSGTKLQIDEPVHLEFVFSTTDQSFTPTLDSYSLKFLQTSR